MQHSDPGRGLAGSRAGEVFVAFLKRSVQTAASVFSQDSLSYSLTCLGFLSSEPVHIM